MSETKPCPECKTDLTERHMEAVEQMSAEGMSVPVLCWVQCQRCGFPGATRPTPEEALTAWNALEPLPRDPFKNVLWRRIRGEVYETGGYVHYPVVDQGVELPAACTLLAAIQRVETRRRAPGIQAVSLVLRDGLVDCLMRDPVALELKRVVLRHQGGPCGPAPGPGTIPP